MLIFIWVSVFILLIFWSLLAWGAYSLVHDDMGWIPAATAWLAESPFAFLVPDFHDWLDWSQSVLQEFIAWLPAAVTIGWALGVIALISSGAIASGLVWLWRRASRRSPPERPVTVSP